MKAFRRIRKIGELFTPFERRRGFLVLGLMLILAVLDTVGVASVMPFLAVLGNPELIESNEILHELYSRGGFTSVDRFLFALGIGAFLLVVLSSTFRIGTTYAVNRYVQMRRYSLGKRLLESYLQQPYTFYLNRNSADLAKSVLSEADVVANKVIKPTMDLVSQIMISTVMVGLFIILDPLLALIMIVTIGGIYITIYLFLRGYLLRIGQLRLQANRDRFQATSEAFGGIKELKLLGRESAFLNWFRRPAARFSRYVYLKQTLSATPRYLIEAIAVGGVLVLALLLMATRDDVGHVLPLLGVYAFGGLRLLPAAQIVYGSMSSLRFGWPAVENIYDDLTMKPAEEEQGKETPRVRLTESIRLQNVNYRYPGAEDHAIHDMNLLIPARTSVAFVGRTGSGKTTTVDLILGLMKPTSGDILIDGRSMDEIGTRAWQRTIGYVPQEIYLADASISENIAFGVVTKHTDQEAVERAARIANIHEFIEGELPHGYDTEVGERGIRLSGGQRQRIGIARALYHDPQVLVFDEATSALDVATEAAIMEAMEALSGEKTLILVAHRITTVERCDQIVVLKGGRMVGLGPASELRTSNAAFQQLCVA